MDNHRYQVPKEDVTKESVNHLIEHRIPWLFLGLLGGISATLFVAKYENILTADVRLAFFIPIIVYLSDALGTQTETIYVRELFGKKKINFKQYILKETLVGLGMGALSGIMLAVFAVVWLSSYAIGSVLFLTMLINLTIAPLLATIIPKLLYMQHSDPALGSGPIATVIQDLISLFVYFLVINLIIFS